MSQLYTEKEFNQYARAVGPAPQPDPFAARDTDEKTVRYGVYVGGPRLLDLSHLIGEGYVQHTAIERRWLKAFTEHAVGTRDESEVAQVGYLEAGPLGDAPARKKVRMKSPKEDAYQIHRTFGGEGFLVAESLTGLAEEIPGPRGTRDFDHSRAMRVFSVVVPADFVDPEGRNLKEFRAYLRSEECEANILAAELSPDLEGRALRFRGELLAKADQSFQHWSQHVNNLKGEWDRYRAEGKGKADFNDVEKELFREVGRVLPEMQQAQANKAVVESVLQHTQQNSSQDALLSMLLEEREDRKRRDAEAQEREVRRDAELAELRGQLAAAAQGGIHKPSGRRRAAEE